MLKKKNARGPLVASSVSGGAAGAAGIRDESATTLQKGKKKPFLRKIFGLCANREQDSTPLETSNRERANSYTTAVTDQPEQDRLALVDSNDSSVSAAADAPSAAAPPSPPPPPPPPPSPPPPPPPADCEGGSSAISHSSSSCTDDNDADCQEEQSPRSVSNFLTISDEEGEQLLSDSYFLSARLEGVSEIDTLDSDSTSSEITPKGATGYGPRVHLFQSGPSTDIEVSLQDVEQHLRNTTIPNSVNLGCGENEDEMSDIGNNSNAWAHDIRYIHEMKWVYNPTPENPAFYTGPVRRSGCHNLPHGRGRLSFVNGDTYQGPFRNGLMHGPDGVYTTQNGSTYQGMYHRNKRHGHGQHTIAGVVRYAGYFEEGIPNGYGRAYHADGTLQYEGVWLNGIPAHKMVPFLGEEASVMSSGQLACDVDSSVDSSSLQYKYSQYDPDRTPQDDATVDSDYSSVSSLGFVNTSSSTGTSMYDDAANRSLDIVEEECVPSIYATSTTMLYHTSHRGSGGNIRKNWSSGDMKPSSLYHNPNRHLEA